MRTFVLATPAGSQLQRRDGPGRAEEYGGDERDVKAGHCASALRGADEVIVTLGDMPRVGPDLIARFLDEPPRTRASYDRRPGHPVVLGAEELARLHELSGDVGARELLKGGRLIECGDVVAGADVDTPEDLRGIRSTE